MMDHSEDGAMTPEERRLVEEAARSEGGDTQGCAACGGTLLYKIDQAGGRVWLTCSGCEREFQLGPTIVRGLQELGSIPNTFEPVPIEVDQ